MTLINSLDGGYNRLLRNALNIGWMVSVRSMTSATDASSSLTTAIAAGIQPHNLLWMFPSVSRD